MALDVLGFAGHRLWASGQLWAPFAHFALGRFRLLSQALLCSGLRLFHLGRLCEVIPANAEPPAKISWADRKHPALDRTCVVNGTLILPLQVRALDHKRAAGAAPRALAAPQRQHFLNICLAKMNKIIPPELGPAFQQEFNHGQYVNSFSVSHGSQPAAGGRFRSLILILQFSRGRV